MTIDFTTIINDAAIALTVIGGLFGLNKKFPFLSTTATYLETNAVAIGKEIELLAETPIGAVVKESLQKEVDKVTASLQNSEVAKLALVGLHSFALKAGELSDTQKAALVKFISESVPKTWNVSEYKIISAINDVEKYVTDFNNLEIVKAANYFTNAQSKTVVPIENATVVTP